MYVICSIRRRFGPIEPNGLYEKEHTALTPTAASFPVLPVVLHEYCHFPMLA